MRERSWYYEKMWFKANNQKFKVWYYEVEYQKNKNPKSKYFLKLCEWEKDEREKTNLSKKCSYTKMLAEGCTKHKLLKWPMRWVWWPTLTKIVQKYKRCIKTIHYFVQRQIIIVRCRHQCSGVAWKSVHSPTNHRCRIFSCSF